MNIEVTQKTFYTIFTDQNNIATETTELTNKLNFNNGEQRGFILTNFVGNVVQYYLIDINA